MLRERTRERQSGLGPLTAHGIPNEQTRDGEPHKRRCGEGQSTGQKDADAVGPSLPEAAALTP